MCSHWQFFNINSTGESIMARRQNRDGCVTFLTSEQIQRLGGIGRAMFLAPLEVEREEIMMQIESLSKEFMHNDTKSGDSVDRGNEENIITERNRSLDRLQLRLQKIDSFTDNVLDSDFDGDCTACYKSIPLARVLHTQSTLCIKCADEAI